VCIFPEDGDNPDLLKVHVNNALVRAKAKIKNSYVFYSPSMNIQNYKQFELRNSLVNAISEKQLDVYFQPLVNLKTNEILGAEALIQWNHPSWGMIMPDELIPIAEETGLIIDIENWMFREICETYARWMDEGRPAVKISVNYSIVNFYEKNFVENIKHTLEEFDLNPGFLIIEISDKIITGNQELILLNINSLQEVGIQVAFDNFGTEFSSFQYLSLFHIDILKLDDGFIKKAMVDRKSNIIVCNLVRMCRELEIKLAAIGIDTIEHLTYLKSLNFHTGQGYLYSKPIPGKEFEKMLYGKKLKIFQVKDTGIVQVERRMYFRIGFSNLLEGSMTISAIQTRKVKLGYTQVLIKDIGPGGLCFISNIKIPANHEIILNFRTVLLGKEIEVSGCPIWTEEFVGNLYTYGVQFNIEENERTPLTGILNKLQIAMKNNMEFSDGDFVCVTPMLYFSRN